MSKTVLTPLPMLVAACMLSAQTARPPASYKDLKFPPLRQIEIPNVERVTLPNGMKPDFTRTMVHSPFFFPGQLPEGLLASA